MIIEKFINTHVLSELEIFWDTMRKAKENTMQRRKIAVSNIIERKISENTQEILSHVQAVYRTTNRQEYERISSLYIIFKDKIKY